MQEAWAAEGLSGLSVSYAGASILGQGALPHNAGCSCGAIAGMVTACIVYVRALLAGLGVLIVRQLGRGHSWQPVQ